MSKYPGGTTQVIMLALAAGLMYPTVVTQAETSRPRAELKCVSFGTGPYLECLVKVQRRDGTPWDGVQLKLGAFMPSMPMAHSIKPVKAISTGAPGEYKATLELEMSGVWTVEVEFSAPVRDKVARNLRIIECADTARCDAAPILRGTDSHNAHHQHVGDKP